MTQPNDEITVNENGTTPDTDNTHDGYVTPKPADNDGNERPDGWFAGIDPDGNIVPPAVDTPIDTSDVYPTEADDGGADSAPSNA